MENQIHEYEGAADPRTRHRMISEACLSDIIGPPNGFSLNQCANEAANRPHPDTLAAKLANLEAEVATLRDEVQMLRASQQRQTGAAIRERFGTDFIK